MSTNRSLEHIVRNGGSTGLLDIRIPLKELFSGSPLRSRVLFKDTKTGIVYEFEPDEKGLITGEIPNGNYNIIIPGNSRRNFIKNAGKAAAVLFSGGIVGCNLFTDPVKPDPSYISFLNVPDKILVNDYFGPTSFDFSIRARNSQGLNHLSANNNLGFSRDVSGSGDQTIDLLVEESISEDDVRKVFTSGYGDIIYKATATDIHGEETVAEKYVPISTIETFKIALKGTEFFSQNPDGKAMLRAWNTKYDSSKEFTFRVNEDTATAEFRVPEGVYSVLPSGISELCRIRLPKDNISDPNHCLPGWDYGYMVAGYDRRPILGVNVNKDVVIDIESVEDTGTIMKVPGRTPIPDPDTTFLEGVARGCVVYGVLMAPYVNLQHVLLYMKEGNRDIASDWSSWDTKFVLPNSDPPGVHAKYGNYVGSEAVYTFYRELLKELEHERVGGDPYKIGFMEGSAHDEAVKDRLDRWGINEAFGAYIFPKPGNLFFAHSGVGKGGKNWFEFGFDRNDSPSLGLKSFWYKTWGSGYTPVNGGPGWVAGEHSLFSFERRISPPIWSVYDHYEDYRHPGPIIHDDEVLLPNDRLFIQLLAGFAAHAQRQLYVGEDGKTYRGFNPWVVPDARMRNVSKPQEFGKMSSRHPEFVITGRDRGIFQSKFTPNPIGESYRY